MVILAAFSVSCCKQMRISGEHYSTACPSGTQLCPRVLLGSPHHSWPYSKNLCDPPNSMQACLWCFFLPPLSPHRTDKKSGRKTDDYFMGESHILHFHLFISARSPGKLYLNWKGWVGGKWNEDISSTIRHKEWRIELRNLLTILEQQTLPLLETGSQKPLPSSWVTLLGWQLLVDHCNHINCPPSTPCFHPESSVLQRSSYSVHAALLSLGQSRNDAHHWQSQRLLC